MIEGARLDGKDSDTCKDWLLVVAGALMTGDGRYLMHQRPEGKMYAGLWEFPGGKVEPSESPAQSLVRELHEELGITLHTDALTPALFAQQAAVDARPPVVLLLYAITQWEGVPQALKGGVVAWLTPAEIMQLPMPPLDRGLSSRLLGHAQENWG
jgi:8-oxo-dGTP diphosphatase